MKNKFLGTGREGYRPLRKIHVAIRGVYFAVALDFAVAYKVIVSLPILAVCFYFSQWVDFSLVLVSTALMLVGEVFNTTIEALCDFIEPNKSEKIGVIKDISAGAAGIGILVWFVVIVLESVRIYNMLATQAAT
ncbi:MAG: hypothetical protein RLZZ303_3331 [Candidatus Hydrogenedentota bacterium]